MKSEKKKEYWLLLDKGAVVEAEYKPAELPKFRGYPYIEALPLINTKEQAIELLQRYPEYNDEMRSLPPHLLSQQVMDLLHFFQPLPIHLKLERMVSRMIREGYLYRNPIDPEYAGTLKERLEVFRNRKSFKQTNVPTATGFSMPGISGMGKSTGMREVLQTYPQVIIHSKYQERDFFNNQVVWLKLECPKSGGSIKALCLSFFEAFDDLLDTTYSEDYGKEGQNTEELMQSMAIVASMHGLGVLVLDEIQNLSAAKSGGAEEMLNFFVQLVNTIGLPVVLIGTFKAIPILSESFRQARRGSGQGDLVWDRMSFDDDWHLFIETMWDFQYVAKKCPLTQEISRALHEVSYGITDLAVRIYMAAQWRAIETGLEEMTEDLIRSAYRDDFRLINRIFELLKSGDIKALPEIQDLVPPAIIPIEAKQRGRSNATTSQGQSDSLLYFPSATAANSGESANMPQSNDDNINNVGTTKRRGRPKSKTNPEAYEEGDLRGIVAHGWTEDPQLNPYQSLLKHGIIRSTAEFA